MGDDIGRNTAYYYNLKTGLVEPAGQSKAKDLLGPYPDEASAARALDTVHERERQKTDEDREWATGAEVQEGH